MTVEFKLPDIGEGVAEGEIVQWLVSVGDTIAEDQSLVEIMTDKVTAEIPSPCNGVIKELRGSVGDVIPVESVIVVIDKDASGGATKPTKKEKKQAAETEASGNAVSAPAAVATQSKPSVSTGSSVSNHQRSEGSRVLAAPATRKLARTLGLDLNTIAGSGPRGRVTPDDVKLASSNPAAACSRQAGSVVTLPSGGGSDAETRSPYTGMRRKIGDHLVKSKQTAPHFAYVDEVDVTDLVKMRKQLKADAAEQGVKLTYLAFIVKAVVDGLKQYPTLNSSLDEASNTLVQKHYYNIGIAVDTPQGLVVPVIHHAENMSILQLALAIQQLSEKARSGTLSQKDITGGTFTITSIGSIGGLFGVPIINYPEVAILGVNQIAQRPVVRDGNIEVADIMYLSSSCDHRVVDGADTARFMNHVKALLESSARLLM
jgi:pyruvate dehydrogenase E2 component (dihydrolipoamide acetyltransferase)